MQVEIPNWQYRKACDRMRELGLDISYGEYSYLCIIKCLDSKSAENFRRYSRLQEGKARLRELKLLCLISAKHSTNDSPVPSVLANEAVDLGLFARYCSFDDSFDLVEDGERVAVKSTYKAITIECAKAELKIDNELERLTYDHRTNTIPT